MQPHLFMWPGLLQSIISSDVHVVLDNVKASKNERYNRNLIAGSEDKRWLTIPFSNFSRELTIDKLLVDNSHSSISSLTHIFLSRYTHADYSDLVAAMIANLEIQSSRLCDIYLCFLDSLSKVGFALPPIVLSSELKCLADYSAPQKGVDKVNAILDEVGASTYLAAQNVRSYSSASDYTVDHVWFQSFSSLEYLQYSQGRKIDTFIPYLSVLDTIASIGIDSTIRYMSECNAWCTD